MMIRGDNREVGFGPEFGISALILAGRRERAAELIEMERRRAGGVSLQRELVRPAGRAVWPGISHLSAPTFDPGRSKVASCLQLGDAWEPAPFAVEVPETERARTSDEPLFPARAVDPAPGPDWSAEPPAQPGEVRFASKVYSGAGAAVILFVRFDA